MKNTISISIFIVCLFTFKHGKSQTVKDSNGTPVKYMAPVDSVIYKHNFGLVYITKDTTAEMYDWLAPQKIDTLSLRNMYSEILDDRNVSINHFKEIQIAENWSPVYLYKGQYYVYSPSDWMASYNVLITDSVIHLLASDYMFYSIKNYSQKVKNQHEFELLSFFNPTKINLSIRFIDKEQKVTLWQYSEENGKVFNRELRVESKNVRQYRMIVNDCLESKCVNEFDFDEREVDELLKNMR